jgi:hypothetical protein
VAIHSIEEGLALYGLGLLRGEEIPDLALLFLAAGSNVLEMAALAGSLAIDHPADRRADLERAVRLAGRAFPDRVEAALTLRRTYAQRGASGELSPREAARLIIDVFQVVEGQLPNSSRFAGESFGIAKLMGLYYSYDDVPFGDTGSVREIDHDLTQELDRLATEASP